MKIEYDNIADAMYIRFKKGKVSKTLKLKDRLIVDMDSRGNVLGIELLAASSQISKGQIGNIEIGLPTPAVA